MRKGENDERIAVGISSMRLGWGRLVDRATGAAPCLSTATWKALPIRGCEPGAKWRLLSCVHMCCLYVLCGEADHPVPLRKGGGKGDDAMLDNSVVYTEAGWNKPRSQGQGGWYNG